MARGAALVPGAENTHVNVPGLFPRRVFYSPDSRLRAYEARQTNGGGVPPRARCFQHHGEEWTRRTIAGRDPSCPSPILGDLCARIQIMDCNRNALVLVQRGPHNSKYGS